MSKEVSEGSDRSKEWFSKRKAELQEVFIKRKYIDYEILMNFCINLLSAEHFNHTHPTHQNCLYDNTDVFHRSIEYKLKLNVFPWKNN